MSDLYVGSGETVSGVHLGLGDDRQYVDSGGKSIGTTVYSGGWQYVSSGGKTIGTTVSSGGYQVVRGDNTYYSPTNVGGIASGSVVREGGVQVVDSSGLSFQTLLEGGSQKVRYAGIASGTSVGSGGRQYISSDGSAIGAQIFSGGGQVVYSGGIASGTSLGGGWQRIEWGASAVRTTISDGWQYVNGGIARNTVVKTDGMQQVLLGGLAVSTTVASGGLVEVLAGAGVKSLNLKSGAEMSIAAGNVIEGANVFNRAVVSGGRSSRRVRLGNGASLSVGARMDMSGLHLKTDSATLTFTSIGNTLGSLQVTSNTQVAFDISSVNASWTAPMLSLSTANSQKKGSFSVTVAKNQGVGVYELSKNLVQSSGTGYTIRLGSTEIGTANLGGSAIARNGMYYRMCSSGVMITLRTAAKAGSMLHGAAGSDTLAGTVHSDVFWGGAGSDMIKGSNGRDVAVYGTGSWGKDVIAGTNGTITILFKDLKASQFTSSLSGTDMTFTRKGVSGQAVTVQGWNSATHNVVFASSMPDFTKWAIAASPTTAQAAAARTEVWKNAGLAQT